MILINLLEFCGIRVYSSTNSLHNCCIVFLMYWKSTSRLPLGTEALKGGVNQSEEIKGFLNFNDTA